MKRVLGLFFLIMFLIGTDTFLISPLLPTLRNQFGVSVSASAWMVGAYAVGYAIFALLAGPLSDGWNRKRVLAYGMIGFSISTFLCGLAPGFWVMLIFRTLAGICAAFAAPQVWASIPVIVPPQKIIKSMGIATAGLAASQTLGVPIGTYLALQSWSTPFFILGGCSLLLVLFIFLYVPNIPPVDQSIRSSILSRYTTLLKQPKAIQTFLAYFIFQTGNFAAFTFLGTWLADTYSMNVNQVGGVLVFLGLGNLIGSFFGGSVVKRIGQKASMLLGFTSMILIYFLVSYAPSVLYVKAAYFLLFLIAGTVFPVMMSLLQTLSSSARGTIAALGNAVMYGATTLGAYLAGILYAHLNGFHSIALFTALSYVISILVWFKSGVMKVEPRQARTQKSIC